MPHIETLEDPLGSLVVVWAIVVVGLSVLVEAVIVVVSTDVSVVVVPFVGVGFGITTCSSKYFCMPELYFLTHSKFSMQRSKASLTVSLASPRSVVLINSSNWN